MYKLLGIALACLMLTVCSNNPVSSNNCVVDTLYNIIEVYDTITIESTLMDTISINTYVQKDSIVYDTIHIDSVHDTLCIVEFDGENIWNLRFSAQYMDTNLSKTSISLDVQKEWTIGKVLTKGETYHILADGVVSYGEGFMYPDGIPEVLNSGQLVPQFPVGCLVGKINNELFYVGATCSFKAPSSDTLFLTCNDKRTLANNTGAYQVTIYYE